MKKSVDHNFVRNERYKEEADYISLSWNESSNLPCDLAIILDIKYLFLLYEFSLLTHEEPISTVCCRYTGYDYFCGKMLLFVILGGGEGFVNCFRYDILGPLLSFSSVPVDMWIVIVMKGYGVRGFW